jgi:hypothetical protein
MRISFYLLKTFTNVQNLIQGYCRNASASVICEWHPVITLNLETTVVFLGDKEPSRQTHIQCYTL